MADKASTIFKTTGEDTVLILTPDKNKDYGGLNGTTKAEQAQARRNKALQREWRRLMIASMLTLVVMVAEVVGGYLADSLAIMTDAAHMLVDFVGFIIALLAIFLARKQPSKRLTHGWYRAEILGALLSVLLIWIMTGVLVYLGIKRVINKDSNINSKIMIITASAALFVNIVLGSILHANCCSRDTHDHGHVSHHGHSHNSMNLRAAMVHVIGDIIQSLSILIGAIVLYFKPSWVIIDPILTILFSVLVFLTTCRLSRDIILVLMEAKPSSIDFTDARRRLVMINGVEGVHSLRIWSLTTGVHVVTVHLVMAGSLDNDDNVTCRQILEEARAMLETSYNVHNATIQIEHADADKAFICSETFDPLDTES